MPPLLVFAITVLGSVDVVRANAPPVINPEDLAPVFPDESPDMIIASVAVLEFVMLV